MGPTAAAGPYSEAAIIIAAEAVTVDIPDVSSPSSRKVADNLTSSQGGTCVFQHEKERAHTGDEKSSSHDHKQHRHGHGHSHGHGHGHSHGFHRDDDDTGVRLVTLGVLNFTYALVELVVALVIGSSALFADSIHNFSDLLATGIAVAANEMRKKPESSTYTYGLGKAEQLGGYTNAVFLVSSSFFIILDSLSRFVFVQEVEYNLLFVIVAAVGIPINIAGILTFTCGQSRRADSVNVRSFVLHQLGDSLGSLSVTALGLLGLFFPGRWVDYADPVVGIAIAIFIVTHSTHILKESGKSLLLSTDGDVTDRARAEMLKILGVESLEKFRAFEISDEKRVAAVTARVSGCKTMPDAARMHLRKVLMANGFNEVTIELDYSPCTSTRDDQVHGGNMAIEMLEVALDD